MISHHIYKFDKQTKKYPVGYFLNMLLKILGGKNT